MTTTAATLASRDDVRGEWVLLIEGLGYVLTTSTASALRTAYHGTEWTQGETGVSWLAHLSIEGAVLSQSITPYKPEIDPPPFSVRVLLEDSAFRAAALGFAMSTAKTTNLTTDVGCTETTLSCRGASQFASSGFAYMGVECFQYTGTTESSSKTTSFTGVTRGRFSSMLQELGYAYPHITDADTDMQPLISSAPRTGLLQRTAALYFHHRNDDGTYADVTDAACVFLGRIVDVTDDGDGWATITGELCTAMLDRPVISGQLRGDVAPGVLFTSAMAGYWISEQKIVAGVVTRESATGALSETGQVQSWGPVLDSSGFMALITNAIQAADAASSIGSSGAKWSIDYDPVANRITVQVTNVTADDGAFSLGLHPVVCDVLGFKPYNVKDVAISSTTYRIGWILLLRTGASTWAATAELAPLDYQVRATPSTGGSSWGDFNYLEVQFVLDNPAGTWAPQTTFPEGIRIPPSTEGFILVGDSAIIAASYNSTTKTVTYRGNLTAYFRGFGFAGSGEAETSLDIRHGDGGRIQMRQVWLEQGPIADIIRRLLYSTGDPGYNGESDVLARAIGIGTPADIIHDASLEALGTRRGTLFLRDPISLGKIIVSACELVGVHPVWRGGLIQFVKPHLVGSTLATTWDLDETNKTSPQDRTRMRYGTASIVNTVQLKSGRKMDGSFGRVTVVEDSVSQTDFGISRGYSYEGLTIGADLNEVDAWAHGVAAEIIAFLGKPKAFATRTADYSLFGIIPGDTARLTDDIVIDPTTGTQGVSSLGAIITGTKWDLQTMTGLVEMVTIPELVYTQTAGYGPSARVDETASNGGYNTTTDALTVYPHAYTDARTQPSDASYFAVGDVIDITELSPATVGSPVTWRRTIGSISGNQIAVTVALSAPAWDSALRYKITYAVITAVANAQLTKTFIADDADNSTGLATNDAYRWAGTPGFVSKASPSYTQAYVKPASTDDDTGRPLSAGDWVEYARSLNALWAHKCRSVLVNTIFPGGGSLPYSTTGLCFGPIWVPLYHWGARRLICRLLIQVNAAGTASAYIRFSARPPAGTWTSPSYAGIPYVDTDTFTTTSLTEVWSGDMSVDVKNVTSHSGGDPVGVWIVVVGTTSETLLEGVYIVEGTP